MDKRLLDIICCPVTHKGLVLARADQLKKINQAIGEGHLVNRNGTVIDAPMKEALLTEDGKLLYPVTDGIPVLLEGESVTLGSLDQV